MTSPFLPVAFLPETDRQITGTAAEALALNLELAKLPAPSLPLAETCEASQEAFAEHVFAAFMASR